MWSFPETCIQCNCVLITKTNYIKYHLKHMHTRNWKYQEMKVSEVFKEFSVLLASEMWKHSNIFTFLESRMDLTMNHALITNY